MGLFGGDSRSSVTQQTTNRDTQGSLVADAGINSNQNIYNILGSDGVTLTDNGAVDKAFEISKKAIADGWKFTGDALSFVDTQSKRNYEFANTVAIPLAAQQTEDFSKYTIGATVVVAGLIMYALKG